MYATKQIICIYKDAYINPALHDFIEMSSQICLLQASLLALRHPRSFLVTSSEHEVGIIIVCLLDMKYLQLSLI